MCEWVTGGAEKPSDRNSLKEKTNSHTVKVSKCLLVDWQLCGPCPLSWLVSPRWCPPHPDGAAPLQGGAAEGEGHAHVPGQQGLPLRLESGLEGGRQQQQQLGGEQEPRGAGEGRQIQLEQHPEAPCRPVGEGGLCDLWGHPGLPDSALRDTEERPVFPVLSWLTGRDSATGFTLTLLSLCSLQLALDFISPVSVAIFTSFFGMFLSIFPNFWWHFPIFFVLE